MYFGGKAGKQYGRKYKEDEKFISDGSEREKMCLVRCIVTVQESLV